MTVVTCRCTAWSSMKDELEKNKDLQGADIILVQEHKLLADRVQAAKDWLRARVWASVGCVAMQSTLTIQTTCAGGARFSLTLPWQAWSNR